MATHTKGFTYSIAPMKSVQMTSGWCVETSITDIISSLRGKIRDAFWKHYRAVAAGRRGTREALMQLLQLVSTPCTGNQPASG